MRTFMKFATVLLLAGSATACDELDALLPDYPEIAGTYDISAPINEVPGGRFTGTLSLLDDGTDTPGFSGSYSLSLYGPDGLNYGNFSGNVVAGTVSTSGGLSFNLDNNEFRWTGNINGRSMTGTWVLSSTDGSYSGTFTGSRR